MQQQAMGPAGFLRLRNRAYFVSDLVLLPVSALLAFAARFEGTSWTSDITRVFWAYLIVSLPLKLLVLFLQGMYRRLWRYASSSDLELVLMAVTACAVVSFGVGLVILPAADVTVPLTSRVSIAVLLLDACLSAGAIALPRLAVRLLARRERRTRRHDMRRAIVVGAGAAGGMIVRELTENPQLGILPVAVLDDDAGKVDRTLNGVPVLGALNRLAEAASTVAATDIVIAMPSASGRTIREVLRRASECNLQTRTVPGLYELLSGEKSVNALRNIEIQDLLRREPIETNLEQVSSLVSGQVVLVTGAGGSIGSELCRQLARLEPARIIALGRGENSIFELMHELTRLHPSVRVEPVIADVRDYSRMRRIMGSQRPFSVFHAAAHKHVPLMEANVSEAVLNNVLGTRNVVTFAAEAEAEHFVLISTDKAVRPTSVMGATKRIAEEVVHQVALERGGGGYVAVRFGNVLGSRGSVVPTFMRQIEAGGPVTITHPDVTRYFMTIPEAVQLVLQAAALGNQGEVFVLDMGEPVRVLDLAMDMIRLSGLEPGSDIEIQFNGLRPGEKLYEELFFSESDATPTVHPKILRARDAHATLREDKLEELIAAAAASASGRELRRLITAIVPEFSGGAFDTGEYPARVAQREEGLAARAITREVL